MGVLITFSFKKKISVWYKTLNRQIEQKKNYAQTVHNFGPYITNAQGHCLILCPNKGCHPVINTETEIVFFQSKHVIDIVVDKKRKKEIKSH